jgi:AraC-like DNA-binding protein
MLEGINLKQKYKIFSKPVDEVEHRTAHHADHASLNVFETSRVTYHFDLKFDNPVVVSMIQGKKIMHLRSKDPFDFFPGQSIVMPAAEMMYIDFPEADYKNPTQCLALEISEGFVKDTMVWLNEFFPKIDNDQWSWTKDNFLLINNPLVQSNLNRLITVMVQNNFGRQLMACNTTKELIVSLMQTQARHFLLQNVDKLSTRNRLAHVIKYIRNNIHSPLSIVELASQACLSRAQFFRAFQRELGETPVQFINRERLQKAKNKLLLGGLNISAACYESGFSSLNYFCRVFKQFEGLSPGEWKEQQLIKIQGKCSLIN